VKKRFWETNAMFKRRWELDQARQQLSGSKLWRIDAIQMLRHGFNGWRMGNVDHFTVEAPSRELAIGKFKTGGRMNWFIVDCKMEQIID
jgi:hypothetical protein